MEGGAGGKDQTTGQPKLLAAIRHFGWGGLGKLRLILDQLPQAEVALYGEGRITGLTEELLGPRHTFKRYPPRQAGAAVVINDSPAANDIAALGVPVIYVDSLPYTRQTDTEIPVLENLACYCAQKYPVERAPLLHSSMRGSGAEVVLPTLRRALVKRRRTVGHSRNNLVRFSSRMGNEGEGERHPKQRDY